MQFGIAMSLLHDAIAQARRAEELGFDYLSTGEHINFPVATSNTIVALAAAAYNAGPGNVRRWLPRDQVMSADLWVETVPFTETRNYVQAVLAYSTVFDKSLGKNTLMSSRMGDIKTRY